MVTGHRSGFYVHLAPGSMFVAAGTWHPDSETVGQIRTAISEDSDAWTEARGAATADERSPGDGRALLTSCV